MQLDFSPPDAEACDALAALHRESLPTSALSALGGKFLRAFYRFAAHSPDERVIVCRQGNVVLAGALISFHPNTLNRRILFKTPLIWAALLNFHRRAVRRAVFGRSQLQWKAPDIPRPATPAPELLALFSRASSRGQGIGSELIAHIDTQLALVGVSRYFVRTLEAQDNPALRFYIRHGFSPVGRLETHGEKFTLLSKELTPDVKADCSA
ncbi:MAG TPA: GNAT family N-acetyltransferase [Magnetovibrio sp.]